MKKRKFSWKSIVVVIVSVVVLVIMLLMYRKMVELTNQLLYLQDTTNIILSDVGGMQSNIKKTLEEEASMVESYSIEIVDMDFSKRSYQVDISVIPKEYTDTTKVSIYFGTIECPLTLDGYVYKGSIYLPIDKSFDGNVTFLLANGKKKATEVLEDYNGLRTDLNQVLSGRLESAPTCKDGKLNVKSNCDFDLNGVDRYEFDSFELVAKIDEEEIWTQDLLEDMKNGVDERQQGDGDENLMVTTEIASEEIASDMLPVNSHFGNAECKLSYELEPGQETVTADHHIRIFLRAATVDGYLFEYDVFQGDYIAGENRLDEDSFDWSSHSVVFDDKGNKLELD